MILVSRELGEVELGPWQGAVRREARARRRDCEPGNRGLSVGRWARGELTVDLDRTVLVARLIDLNGGIGLAARRLVGRRLVSLGLVDLRLVGRRFVGRGRLGGGLGIGLASSLAGGLARDLASGLLVFGRGSRSRLVRLILLLGLVLLLLEGKLFLEFLKSLL